MTRNSTVIKKFFLRRTIDSMFKLLTFMQQWCLPCKRWDNDRLGDMVHGLQLVGRQPSAPPPLAVDSTPLRRLISLCFLVFVHFCVVAPANLLSFFSHLDDLLYELVGALFMKRSESLFQKWDQTYLQHNSYI